MPFLLRFKVSGHSMEPFIPEDAQIIVSSIPYIFRSPKIGDVVAFKYEGKNIVKRILKIKEGMILTRGDNRGDSKEFGWIDKKMVLGMMIYKYA
jgi:phage repressor protein C with HTH and peptisase S24 domain